MVKRVERKRSFLNLLWGIGLAIAVGLLIFGVELLFAYLLTWIFGSKLDTPLGSALYQALIYLSVIAILLLVPNRIRKLSNYRTDRNELGLSNLPTWTDIGLAIVGLLAYFLLAGVITYAFTYVFTWFNAEEAQDVGFNNLYAVSDRLIAFVALVIVAPIAEELIFRGWLYGKLRRRLSLVPAMLIVSVIFGVLHGQWNVGVNVFALSLVLCGLREITGTTYAGILVHMLKNGLAFYLLYVAGM